MPSSFSEAFIGSQILYRHPDFLVVNKPPGIVTSGPSRSFPDEASPRESLESLLSKHLGQRLWPVHQLDRLTSGAVLIALRKSAVAPLASLLKIRGAKHYVALVHGVPKAPQDITYPWTRSPHPRLQKIFPSFVTSKEALLMAAKPKGKHATFPVRPAHTRLLQVLSTSSHADFSWLAIELLTGRQHQVRLHLHAIKHPLVGEAIHCASPCPLHTRHALHATSLCLNLDKETVTIHAPLPADLLHLSQKLNVTTDWESPGFQP